MWESRTMWNVCIQYCKWAAFYQRSRHAGWFKGASNFSTARPFWKVRCAFKSCHEPMNWQCCRIQLLENSHLLLRKILTLELKSAINRWRRWVAGGCGAFKLLDVCWPELVVVVVTEDVVALPLLISIEFVEPIKEDGSSRPDVVVSCEIEEDSERFSLRISKTNRK